MRKRLNTPAILILAVLLAGTQALLATSGHREQEVSTQVHPIAADGTFNLKNVNGPVTVRAWEMPTVEIVMTKSGRTREDLDKVKVEVTADPRRVSVEAIFPRSSRNMNVSVAFEVRLPRTVALREIETVNGSVEVEGMASLVEVSTVNGSVQVLNTSGPVRAETVNGSLKAEFTRIAADADLNFSTVNGGIKLYLPENSNAEVSASTVNGGMQTDFPLTVQGKLGSKSLKGTLGRGGARIRMETVNGGIDLRRGPGLGQDARNR